MDKIGNIKDLGKMVEDSIKNKVKMLVEECENYTKSQDIELIVKNESSTDIAFYHNFQNGKLILKIIDTSTSKPDFETGYPEVLMAESSRELQMLLRCTDDSYIDSKSEDIPMIQDLNL